jgi:hypothetical protein
MRGGGPSSTDYPGLSLAGSDHNTTIAAALRCLTNHGEAITKGWEIARPFKVVHLERLCGGAKWSMTIDWWREPQKCMDATWECLGRGLEEGAVWVLAEERKMAAGCGVRVDYV